MELQEFHHHFTSGLTLDIVKPSDIDPEAKLPVVVVSFATFHLV
jgi:hypothetical protein